MNTLSFRTSEENGFSIELLIDGQSFIELVGYDSSLIPHYMFEGDLPQGYWGEADPNIKCIGICCCGAPGCGDEECRVIRQGDVVIFRDFSGIVNPKHPSNRNEGIEFRVSSVNYDSVMADIMRQVGDYIALTKLAREGDCE
jgi:hypothetical protein